MLKFLKITDQYPTFPSVLSYWRKLLLNNYMIIYPSIICTINTNQLIYRTHHSTESALLRVNNDILCALDLHEEVILVLLDLSAAFDTIDHSILFSRLEHRFGIRGIALDWIKSYFSDRSQRVIIGDQYSKPSTLIDGVPQGSCFGPILFTLILFTSGRSYTEV